MTAVPRCTQATVPKAPNTKRVQVSQMMELILPGASALVAVGARHATQNAQVVPKMSTFLVINFFQIFFRENQWGIALYQKT